MRFTFNHLSYEVPEGVGISIRVDVDDEHADFNFVKDDDDIPMHGGTDENGNNVESWDDVGIRKLP